MIGRIFDPNTVRIVACMMLTELAYCVWIMILIIKIAVLILIFILN